MKFLIASDIHGSAYFCDLLIKAIEKEKADKVLLLGDALYHGPRNDLSKDYNPKVVLEMLNDIREKILYVRGNCDSEVDQMVLNFPILADYCIISLEKTVIYATHGHIYNPKNLPPLSKGDILLNGHTHVPKCEVCSDYIYMNCGSVSIPKENSPHSYMVLEKGEFSWKNLENGEIYNSFKL